MSIRPSSKYNNIKQVMSDEEKMRKTSIFLPDSIWLKIKDYALRNDLTMKDIFIKGFDALMLRDSTEDQSSTSKEDIS